jgi:probable HAF family extracellular repeat protein
MKLKIHLTSFCLAACLVLTAAAARAQSPASCSFHTFTIPSPNGVSEATGINRYNNIVGTTTLFTSGKSHGFLRYSNGSIAVVNDPNGVATTLSRRNDQGVQVGWYDPGNNRPKGFVNHGSTFQTFTYPGAVSTFPTSVNKWGTIVGEYMGTDNHFHGFRWNGGHFTTIHPNGAVDTQVTGINDNGVIVGHFSTGGADENGFIDRNGAITTLNFPGEVGFGGTILTDISDNGQIIGWVWTGSDTTQAFVYTSGKFKTFSVPGSRFTRANGISSLGVMVGHTILLSSNGETDAAFTATCQ